MKNLISLFTIILTAQLSFGQGVGIGTSTPAASAKLEVSSTTQGMLVPRMTTAQRTSIASPASGLLVFDLTTNSFWFKGGSDWVEIIDSVNTKIHRSAADKIYMGMTDKVGIGVIAPANKLDIQYGSPRAGIHSTGRPLYVTGDIGPASNGIEFMHNSGLQGIGIGFNTMYAAGSSAIQDLGLAAKGSTGALRFLTNGTEKMFITGNGNVGIGTSVANAPLQFAGVEATRKIVLYEGANNDNQFFGFGINASALRYQAMGDHVFYYGSNSTTSIEQMRVTSGGNVGIGTSSPHAPLQFNNLTQNRKIVLLEAANNEHQYYGLGVNGGILRYQVSNPGDNHVFYAGTSPSTSDELMRIQGDGNVGIKISTPQNRLDIQSGPARTGSHATGRALYVTGDISESGDGVEFRHYNGTQGIGFGYNTIYATGSDADQNLGIQARGETGNVLFTTNGTERMRVAGNGNVGIGTATPMQKLHVGGNLTVDNNIGAGHDDPHAPLQFGNNLQNRKIVLYEGNNNDHQYYGFGVNDNGAGGYNLRYQVSTTSDNHIFYAATSSTASNELMRITGSGNVGIGTPTPTQKLDVNGSVQVSGSVYMGYTFQFTGANILPGTSLTVSCDCLPGTKTVGGGWSGPGLDVVGSRPASDGSKWNIDVNNLDPFNSHWLSVYVTCARIGN